MCSQTINLCHEGGGEGDTYSCVMREEVRVIHIAVS